MKKFLDLTDPKIQQNISGLLWERGRDNNPGKDNLWGGNFMAVRFPGQKSTPGFCPRMLFGNQGVKMPDNEMSQKLKKKTKSENIEKYEILMKLYQ